MASATHYLWKGAVVITWYWSSDLPRVLFEVQISLVGVKVIVIGCGFDVQI